MKPQGVDYPPDDGRESDDLDPGIAQAPPEANAACRRVIGAAIEVHRTLGAGFIESVYERALCIELRRLGIFFVSQPLIEVSYKGEAVGEGRLDLIVQRCLVVELKAIEAIKDVHLAQVRSYLRATGLQLGLIINFNVVRLRDSGIRRVVNL
ncbi:MAG: GxxExxY protein [Dehalococcoidia bacterium]